MAVGGFRHIPLVEDGRPTGLVTARDVFRHLLASSADARARCRRPAVVGPRRRPDLGDPPRSSRSAPPAPTPRRSGRRAAPRAGPCPGPTRAIVDLTARAYDGVAAIAPRGRRRAAGPRRRASTTIVALRGARSRAGAERVYAYRKLFEDGPAHASRAWLGPRRPRRRPAARLSDASTRPTGDPRRAVRGPARRGRARGGRGRASTRCWSASARTSLPHRLRGDAARAADDAGRARRRAGRRSSCRASRPRRRAAAGRGRRPRRRSRPGRRPRTRWRSSRRARPAARRAAPPGRRLRPALGDPPAAAPGRAAGRALRARRRPSCATCGWSRTPTRSTLLRLAAEAADRVVDQIAAGPARRPDRGRRRPRGPRAAPRRGPRPRRVRDRRLRAQLRLAAPRGVGPGDPGRRADRPRHRRDRSAATAATSPGRSGSPAATPAHGPDDEFLRLYAVLRARPGRGDRTRSGRASPASAIDARRAGRSSPRRATATQFIHRTGHGIGLEGHEEPYLVAGNAEPLRARDGLQRRARASTSRAATAPGSRTSSSAATDGPVSLKPRDRDLLVVTG